MAMQPEIRYISYYMDGNAAKQMERQLLARPAAPKPKRVRKHKCLVLRVDPAAIVGIVAAIVMLVTLLNGVFAYRSCMQRQEQMRNYIEALQQENTQLQATYEAGYDLQHISQIAQAIGMVPRDSVQKISIDVQVPVQAQEAPSFWERAVTFLTGLFA